MSVEDLDAVRAAIREWANAEKRNGPKSVDLPDIVEMLIATGMRIGELLALRWSDIELTAPPERRDDETWFPWLMVNGQITSKGKRVDYGKTHAAIRPIALPDWAAALLRRRKVAQPPNDLDAVFVTRNGTWHFPTNVQGRLWHIRQLDDYADLAALRTSRPTPSAEQWQPRSTRSTTPRPPRTSSATRPRRSPSGTTSTDGSWCRTTAPRPSALLLGLSPPTIPKSGSESPQTLGTAPLTPLRTTRRPRGRLRVLRGLHARQRGARKLKVRPKCALSPDFRGRRQHPDLHHRRSEPVFVSSATHSTWCVIGKTPMVLSVDAILCDRLRS